MSWTHFDWHESDGVGTLTFDRPDRLNALTFDVYRDLVRLFSWLSTPEGARVRSVVLTGRGRGFCTGGDIEGIMGPLLQGDLEMTLEFTRMTCEVIRAMRRAPQPILAAINGTTAGAGAVLALASDLRIVAEGVKVHFLFVKVGLTGADMGAAWMLPRLIGEGRAMEILLTGDPITAEQALAWGFANRVVPADRVLADAHAWALRLAEGPQEAIRLTKRAIHAEASMSFDAALDFEAHAQAVLLRSADHREFFDSHAEKRPPKWR
jgi:enoyl-CoA hydratase/carnithine racemase